MQRLPLCTLALVTLTLLAGCKTTTPACQQEIDACLARCRRSGADENPPQGTNPQWSLSWCEDECQNCREPKSAPAPAPSAPPTYTGTAK
jgi:hypothetical protein